MAPGVAATTEPVGQHVFEPVSARSNTEAMVDRTRRGSGAGNPTTGRTHILADRPFGAIGGNAVSYRFPPTEPVRRKRARMPKPPRRRRALGGSGIGVVGWVFVGTYW